MIFNLVHDTARHRAIQAVKDAPEGWCVRITPPTRNLEQSAKFHAICGDVARQVSFAGKLRDAAAWKVLLISGHSIATKEGSEIVPGLEGEFCNIRESSATMSKKRMASLIEYCLCFCAENAVELSNESRIE